MFDIHTHNNKRFCAGIEPAATILSRGGGGGVGVKADCLNIGPRPIGGMPSVGVFLRYPSPYLREFLFPLELICVIVKCWVTLKIGTLNVTKTPVKPYFYPTALEKSKGRVMILTACLHLRMFLCSA